MDIFANAAQGFVDALTPQNLLFCFIGVVIGTVVGILPGLGPATGISLLLPLTLGLPPLPALIMLAGIYYGCMHGGIIAAVLIATPGESSAVVAVMDGHTLARRGRAGPVLAMSALSSFLAGTLTIPFVMAATSFLGSISLKFGPPETSMIMLIGLVGVVGFVGNNRAKGFAMAAAGLLVSTIGLDVGTGVPRFTFGIDQLFGGIDFLYVVIGIFALAEIMFSIGIGQPEPIRTRLKDMLITREDWRHSRMPILRGGALGLFVGMLPGAGATVASFLDYDMERRIGKRKGRELGTGVIEGVSGPQAADNGAANGAFIPTLSLGIPGSAATAILLGGFLLHGIQPGPLLMTNESKLVWGLLASFYIGNLMLILVNIPLAPVFASILRFKYSYLYPGIIVLCFVGAFSVNTDMTGVWLAYIFGALGWLGRKYDYPLAPMILGVILGTPFERAVVQSAEIGRGSLGLYLHRPIAILLFAVVLLMALGPTILARYRAMRAPKAFMAAASVGAGSPVGTAPTSAARELEPKAVVTTEDGTAGAGTTEAGTTEGEYAAVPGPRAERAHVTPSSKHPPPRAHDSD